MKNTLFFILIILISISSYLFFSSILDIIDGVKFEITRKDIRDAIVLGICIPSTILISRRIKNGLLFVLLAIVAVFMLLFVIKLFL